MSLGDMINKSEQAIDEKYEFEYDINTLNLNGEFVEAEGEIKIFKLKNHPQAFKSKYWERVDKKLYTKDEWYTQLPGNYYDNENESANLEKEAGSTCPAAKPGCKPRRPSALARREMPGIQPRTRR
jgi:hypothetical protein